jgi:hypothetical protein
MNATDNEELRIFVERFMHFMNLCIAGLLFFVLQARRTLGAYRIPGRPAFSSHLVSHRIAHVGTGP